MKTYSDVDAKQSKDTHHSRRPPRKMSSYHLEIGMSNRDVNLERFSSGAVSLYDRSPSTYRALWKMSLFTSYTIFYSRWGS